MIALPPKSAVPLPYKPSLKELESGFGGDQEPLIYDLEQILDVKVRSDIEKSTQPRYLKLNLMYPL